MLRYAPLILPQHTYYIILSDMGLSVVSGHNVAKTQKHDVTPMYHNRRFVCTHDGGIPSFLHRRVKNQTAQNVVHITVCVCTYCTTGRVTYVLKQECTYVHFYACFARKLDPQNSLRVSYLAEGFDSPVGVILLF